MNLLLKTMKQNTSPKEQKISKQKKNDCCVENTCYQLCSHQTKHSIIHNV